MSRVGKQPITIPDKVKVSVNGSKVVVEGPLGRLERSLNSPITCEVNSEKKQILVKRPGDSKLHRMLHGLERALINNMVNGVTKGYRKELEIVGIGYNVRLEGKAVLLLVGFANVVKVDILEGIKVDVLQSTNPGRLAVTGCDKQQVGQLAASIRAVRPPEPYQGKGIKYSDEVIHRKAGKAFAGAGG